MAIDQSITSRKINAKSASAYRAAFTAMADVVRTDRRAKIGLGIVAFAVSDGRSGDRDPAAGTIVGPPLWH